MSMRKADDYWVISLGRRHLSIHQLKERKARKLRTRGRDVFSEVGTAPIQPGDNGMIIAPIAGTQNWQDHEGYAEIHDSIVRMLEFAAQKEGVPIAEMQLLRGETKRPHGRSTEIGTRCTRRDDPDGAWITLNMVVSEWGYVQIYYDYQGKQVSDVPEVRLNGVITSLTVDTEMIPTTVQAAAMTITDLLWWFNATQRPVH